MGYKLIAADFEYLGDASQYMTRQKSVSGKTDAPDLNEILKRAKACSDPAERKRIIEEYNAQVTAEKKAAASNKNSEAFLYDARADMEWIIKRAPNFGLHFLFYFEQAVDFMNLRMDSNLFKHKILFSMSVDASNFIMGRKKASEIGSGVFLYKTTDKEETYLMRPHIFKGIPLNNGWFVDNSGYVVQKL